MFVLLASQPTTAQDKQPDNPQHGATPPAPTTITTIVNEQSTKAQDESTKIEPPGWYKAVNKVIPVDAILILVTGLTGLAEKRERVRLRGDVEGDLASLFKQTTDGLKNQKS
jgi:hypothetical protein